MESAKLNKLGLRLSKDWNIYDLLTLTKADGITDSQYSKLSILRDVIAEYNSSIPVDKRYKINGPNEAAALLYMVMKGKPVEECWVLYLNHANKVLRRKRVTFGGTSSTVFDTQVILRDAIYLNASGIILSHNHPAGDPKPSRADISATKQLTDGANTLGINLMDHIIITDTCYYSFSDERKSNYDEALLKKLLQ